MTVSLASRVTVPPSVLVSNVGEESVLLNLDSERYFGLDPVGTRMWEALSTHGVLDAAHAALLWEFDVDAERLRQDLCELVEKLKEYGLVEVADE